MQNVIFTYQALVENPVANPIRFLFHDGPPQDGFVAQIPPGIHFVNPT